MTPRTSLAFTVTRVTTPRRRAGDAGRVGLTRGRETGPSAALRTTDRGAYLVAARLLGAMRAAARAAGREDESRAFVAETAEANRRRPTCLQIFRAQGLIRADRSAV